MASMSVDPVARAALPYTAMSLYRCVPRSIGNSILGNPYGWAAPHITPMPCFLSDLLGPQPIYRIASIT